MIEKGETSKSVRSVADWGKIADVKIGGGITERSKGKVTDMQIADPQNQEKLKPGVDVIIL